MRHRARKPKELKEAPKDHPDYVAAERLRKTVPGVILGLERPAFFALLGGLARLARGVVKDSLVQKELARVEDACLTAAVLDLVEVGETSAINAPGGSDVRPS